MLEEFKIKFKINELKVLEFNHWCVSVRPIQPVFGSLVLSLVRACDKIEDLTADETHELSLVLKKIKELLHNNLGVEKLNILCLMMVDKQVHFHIIPRYEKSFVIKGVHYNDSFFPSPVDLSYDIEENLCFKVYDILKSNNTSPSITIGYTTGVYDLFHIGHLNLLKRAKQFCDYLVVGVTTDELSLSRKNKKPVIPFDERMEIVKNIKFVDKVVPQEHMDKMQAWKEHRFDVMFVGSDWKGTDKWNQMEIDFKEVGVEIVYFPYTDSTSSTLLRSVLNKI